MRCKGRNRKTWKKKVDDDMKVLGLHCNLSGQFSGMCGGTSHGRMSKPTRMYMQRRSEGFWRPGRRLPFGAPSH